MSESIRIVPKVIVISKREAEAREEVDHLLASGLQRYMGGDKEDGQKGEALHRGRRLITLWAGRAPRVSPSI